MCAPYVRVLSLESTQVCEDISVYLIALQIWMMRLFGDGHRMGNTLLRAHIASNL
jgi:hypothetical protein